MCYHDLVILANSPIGFSMGVSMFDVGGLGVETCSQPTATVRNEDMGSAAKLVTFLSNVV
jgi:hypothetical protein